MWKSGQRDSVDEEWLQQSAEAGCAWGQHMWAEEQSNLGERVSWWERAVRQGEPEAMTGLGKLLLTGGRDGVAEAVERGTMLLKEAAGLGVASAQYVLAMKCCKKTERNQWLRRAAVQEDDTGRARKYLCVQLCRKMRRHNSAGRVVFEFGAAVAACDKRSQPLLARMRYTEKAASRAAADLHRKWCSEAQRGVLCWMWVARLLGVVRDVRLLVAGLVWHDRAAWSEHTLAVKEDSTEES